METEKPIWLFIFIDKIDKLAVIFSCRINAHRDVYLLRSNYRGTVNEVLLYVLLSSLPVTHLIIRRSPHPPPRNLSDYKKLDIFGRKFAGKPAGCC